MDDYYFTIQYILDVIPKSPAGHKIPAQAKNNIRIITINVEDTITAKDTIYELKHCHNQCGKYKVKIILSRNKIYQRTYIEEIRSIFYQVWPVVSHIEICLPENFKTPKNIGEALKGPKRKFWKGYLSFSVITTRILTLFQTPCL